MARLDLERASGGIAVRRDLQGRLSLEGGEGRERLPARHRGRPLARDAWAGASCFPRVYLGVGTDGLPPHRSFVMGGRGTLVGEPFRAYGGRTAALAHLEWRFQVPVPAIPLGSFASTGPADDGGALPERRVRRPADRRDTLGRDATGSGRWPAWRSSGSCA